MNKKINEFLVVDIYFFSSIKKFLYSKYFFFSFYFSIILLYIYSEECNEMEFFMKMYVRTVVNSSI